MNPVVCCPDRSQLREHLEGSLAAGEQARMIAHLDGCEACRRALEGLASGDGVLLAVAREVGQETPATDLGLAPVVLGYGAEDTNQGRGTDPADDEPLAPDFLDPPDQPGHLGRLGPYQVLEVRGRGGMGVVLRAFEPALHRVVAIKVLAPQLAAGATARRRFVREAQAAAAVRDDHVVAIHAVGEAKGLPYLVMEYVEGPSLQERLDRDGALPVEDVLRIGAQVAQGLAAAHAHGLVHRDVKPANILLENGVARVKLTDFGLARAADDAVLTQSGVVAGTPQYMAPEQARGEAVDHRADLFSLGSVLYAMCTGLPPFRGGSPFAVLKRVCEEETRPAHEVNAAAPAWLGQTIAGLQAKDPAERSPSAADLAVLLSRRLARLQDPEPEAVPAPRRRRLLWAAAVLLLLGGLGMTEATGVTGLAATVIRILTPDGVLVVEVDDPAVKVTVEGDGSLLITGAGPQEVRLRPGSYRLQATKDGETIKNEVITITRGDKRVVKVALESPPSPGASSPFPFKPLPPGPLDRLDPAQIPAAERFAWQPKELVAVLGEHRQRHWGRVSCVAWSKDGKRVASGGDNNVIRVWDAETMRELAVLRGHTRDVLGVAFSPDGRRILSGSLDKTLRLWDVENGKELHHVEASAPVNGVALSPDGLRALSAGNDSLVRLWDVQTGKELCSLTGHTNGAVKSVAFSPDGRRALSGGGDNTLRLWDLEGRKELHCLQGHTGIVNAVAFSPDGRRALSCNIHRYYQKEHADGPAGDYHLRLWDLEAGKEVRRFEGHTRRVWGVSFSADGRRALSCAEDAAVRLWEVDTGKELRRFEGHEGSVIGVAFSPDDRRALSGGGDGTVRLWDVEAGQEIGPIAGPISRARRATFSADGRFVLAAGGDRIVRVWDVETGKERQRFTGHTDPVVDVALARDNRRALSASFMADWPSPQPANGDRTGPWLLWDVDSGQAIRRFPGPSNIYTNCVALSPDGRYALTGCFLDMLLWDVESGRELRRFVGHKGSVCGIAFAPDGRRALSASWDCTVRIWDVPSGETLRCLTTVANPKYGMEDIAVSPDGRLVASAGPDQAVWLWDLTTAQTQGRSFLKWHTHHLMSVAFAPNGKRLASSGLDGRVILWDVAGGDKVQEWQSPGPVFGVAFAPDGRHLATANGNGTVYVLRLTKP
jgi:eukaryotic-like serine/threonine-protein kinase